MRSTLTSPAKSKAYDQETANIATLKKVKFSISNPDVSPVMPVNEFVNDYWIYQTISGTVKYAPILGDLGILGKSNHKASGLLNTTQVAAMQILTLAVPVSERYKAALEQFNK
jgi:hypothetical protein